jgi:hypothetical protein
LRSPSVFNFFRPGYVPPNTRIGQQELVAPEFQIANESPPASGSTPSGWVALGVYVVWPDRRATFHTPGPTLGRLRHPHRLHARGGAGADAVAL